MSLTLRSMASSIAASNEDTRRRRYLYEHLEISLTSLHTLAFLTCFTTISQSQAFESVGSSVVLTHEGFRPTRMSRRERIDSILQRWWSIDLYWYEDAGLVRANARCTRQCYTTQTPSS
eukprot:1905435-Amphidinium_carterae.1